MAGLRARFRLRAATDRDALLQALTTGDAAELRRIAHGLAGSGGTFGFGQISDAALALEEAAEAGRSGEPLRARVLDLVRLIDSC